MEQRKDTDFTSGRILSPLLRFTFPILAALILQAMYGAVDLMIVGHFGMPADVSAVATGTQLMQSITGVIASLSVGTTILIGQSIGAGNREHTGSYIGTAIWLFGILALCLSFLIPLCSRTLCSLLQAPQDAFDQTVSYVSICAGGSLFLIAYNVLGSIFRGIGDSRTPLIAVLIACVTNIFGDLLFVAGFGMAASGAALATVLAQGISVALCLLIIRRRGLPFPFHRSHMVFNRQDLFDTLRLGSPIALQDLLVSISFLVLLAIVNSLGVVVSAGVGVAEKVCAFIMLIPSAFSQALSSFVAQNTGARQPARAWRATVYGMLTSFGIGVIIAAFSFFRGDLLCSLFATDPDVLSAGAAYLRAYAIDTMLVSFLFCYIGYFNGLGCTRFVMLQGLIGAFCVRIPVSFLMSRRVPLSLFGIGLATPCSTFLQIILFTVYKLLHDRSARREV